MVREHLEIVAGQTDLPTVRSAVMGINQVVVPESADSVTPTASSFELLASAGVVDSLVM